MVGVKTLPETTFKFTEASGKSFEAKNLTEFVTNNESQTGTADIDAPIVFVGYGIKAPGVPMGRLQERRPAREGGAALRERAQLE